MQVIIHTNNTTDLFLDLINWCENEGYQIKVMPTENLPEKYQAQVSHEQADMYTKIPQF